MSVDVLENPSARTPRGKLPMMMLLQIFIWGAWLPLIIMPVMSIGQVAEILTMVVLGTVLKKPGWRITMIVGVLGYAFRFAEFAWFPESTVFIILVNLVHGVCYAFFFATVYIFVDANFPADARSGAHGLFYVTILGIGALIAHSNCPWLLQTVYTVDGVTDFKSMFMIPMVISILAAVLLAVAFRTPTNVTGSDITNQRAD